MKETGVGRFAASALVTGRTAFHAELEDRLARFEKQESAVLFPSGYAANVGTIAALASCGGCDLSATALNHASLVDGSRLSGAKLRVYRHGKLDALDALDGALAKAVVVAPAIHRDRQPLQHGRRRGSAQRICVRLRKGIKPI